MSSISIIVPTYNEEENIDPLLERIFAVPGLKDIELEVIFSDGASTDDTCRQVERWLDRAPVRLVRASRNEGLSAAVIAGARAAAGEVVVVIDADLSHPPEAIPELTAPLFDGSRDMTIGSRYVTGGATPEWPLSRKISSKIATLPARMLTDVKDPMAGFMAVRREALAGMDREVHGFKIGLELLATSPEVLRVKEIPIVFSDRCYGTSKMGLPVIFDYFRQLLALVGVDEPVVNRFQWLLPTLIVLLALDCTIMTALLHGGVAAGIAHCWSLAAVAMGSGGFCLFRYWRRVQTIIPRKIAAYVFGFCWVALMVTLLRGGLVAMLADSGGGLSTTAVLTTALFGLALGYLANVCYVFSIGRKRVRRDLVLRYYGFGAFLCLALLRFLYLGSVPALPEEIGHIEQFFSWFPFSFILAPDDRVVPLTEVGSTTLFLFRLVVWLLWLGSTVCVFSLARIMFDRSTAFMACLVLAVLPFFFGCGFFLSSDAFMVLCWSCCLYVLYRTLVNDMNTGWPWAGVVLGLGMAVDRRITTLLAAVVVYLLLHEKNRRRLRSSLPYLALGGLLFAVLPALFVTTESAIVARPGWLSTLLGSTLGHGVLALFLLLSPTGILAGGYSLMSWLRPRPADELGRAHDWFKERTYVVLMFFLPLLIFLLPGLFKGGPVAEGEGVWLVLLPTMALAVGSSRAVENAPVRRLLQLIWWPTIGLLMTGYGIGFQLAVL